MRSLLSSFLGLAMTGAGSVALASLQSDAALAERARYMACLDQVETRADEAIEEAQTWRMQGGGWPARECEARALIELGEDEVGAAILDELAQVARAGNDTPTRISQLVTAGETWLGVNKPAEARASFGFALELVPEDTALRAAHAGAIMAEEDWETLGHAASALILRAPHMSEGWYYRAKANLEAGALPAARSDITEAQQRDPKNIDVLVLRGQIINAQRQEES